MKVLWFELRDGIDLERRAEVLGREVSLAITDCKSAYDALNGVAVTAVADKTTALDSLVVRQVLARAGITVRWVPGGLQLADALTKDQATACDLLRSSIKGGTYTIADEIQTLQRRAEEKQRRLEKGRKRAQEAEENQKKKTKTQENHRERELGGEKETEQVSRG